ncbi:MAG: acylphosphatase [Stellaceae bacterium]
MSVDITRTAVAMIVTGRVQGVGFRAFVERHATALRLDGWVRNRRDGSVEIRAIGDAAKIDLLAARCREGPRLAEIVNVAVSDAEDDASVGFDQRPTV